MQIQLRIVEDDGREVELYQVSAHPLYGWQHLREPIARKTDKGKGVSVFDIPPDACFMIMAGNPAPPSPPVRPAQPPDPPGTPYRQEKILDGGGRRE